MAIVRFFPLVKQKGPTADILRAVRDLSRILPDCFGCWLEEDSEFLGTVTYIEQWESEEALFRHLRSDLYSRVLEAMELSAKAPEICFHQVCETRGMDLIQMARQPNPQLVA